MTNHAPIDQPIMEILNQYNPLEIKDILLNGSWRKAVHHKDWDDVLAYYQEYDSYIHHYLLDSPDAWNHYGMMQKAYSMTDHTQQDQKDYIKDVFYLYLDVLASDIGHKWNLHSQTRQQIEDDVLAIELKIRKENLGVIDGGKGVMGFNTYIEDKAMIPVLLGYDWMVSHGTWTDCPYETYVFLKKKVIHNGNAKPLA